MRPSTVTESRSAEIGWSRKTLPVGAPDSQIRCGYGFNKHFLGRRNLIASQRAQRIDQRCAARGQIAREGGHD